MKRLKNTKKIQFLYQVLCIIVISISVILLSKRVINIHDKKVLLAIVIYVASYIYLGNIYEAFRCGKYRLKEIIYFQALSTLLTDLLLYLLFILIFYQVKYDVVHVPFTFISFIDIFMLWILQNIILIFISSISIYYYDRFLSTTAIGMIYGNEGFYDFTRRLMSKRRHFVLKCCLEDSEDEGTLLEAIKQLDRLYLYEVNPRLKKKLVIMCEKNNTEVYVTRDIDDLVLIGYDSYNLFDVSFLKSSQTKYYLFYNLIKRLIDIIASLIGIVVLAPIMFIVALAIKIEDKGPVLYSQRRYTIKGKIFNIYKFRSMILTAEEDGKAKLAEKNDQRITKVGKIIRMTRLDELPQLFNILLGEMTIVGPRPERPEIADNYVKTLPEFEMRLKVKAGLTGYAQVFGRYNTTTKNKLRMDLLYIRKRSILLDLKIILITIKIMFMKSSTEGVDATSQIV